MSPVRAALVILVLAASLAALAGQILIGLEPGPWHGSCDGIAWQAEASSLGILVLERDCPSFAGRAGRGKWQLARPVFDRPPIPLLRECLPERFTVYNVAGREVFSRFLYQSRGSSFEWDGVGNDGRRVAVGWYFWRSGDRVGRVVIAPARQ
jgi:hypothetical protein